MDLESLKLASIGLDPSQYGRVFSFVDFGNVNYWYKKDRIGSDGYPLSEEQRLVVDIPLLAKFLSSFSAQNRFYYGWHTRMPRSQHILIKADRSGFIKVTKPIQYIRHYLTPEEMATQTSSTSTKLDKEGWFVEIPKGNFDVEISVDSVRLLDKYDTFCLLSGDSDFVHLIRFLKKKRKKVIIIASGHVAHDLKDEADLYLNAQKVKTYIATIKTNRTP